MFGNSVALNHCRLGLALHVLLRNRLWINCSMAISRLVSSEPRSLDILCGLAGAIFWLLTMPNPFGVSTKSNDGTARMNASWTTTSVAQVRSGSVSSMASSSGTKSSPMNWVNTHRSAWSSHGRIFSWMVVSPSTVSKALGRYLRNCWSDVISRVMSVKFQFVVL